MSVYMAQETTTSKSKTVFVGLVASVSTTMASPTLAEPLVTKKGDDWRSRWLLRYILCAATMAFTGRAAPLAFLPLVLKESFGQSDGVIGLVIGRSPLSSLSPMHRPGSMPPPAQIEK